MTDVTISELPAAAVPYPAGSLFELSVPDGIGGFNSFKGTLADIVAATLVDPQITITGAFPAEPIYVVISSFGLQSMGQFFSSIGGAAIEAPGDSLGALPDTVTAVGFAAVTGVKGDLNITGHFVDEILLPELAVVDGVLHLEGSITHDTTIDLSNLTFTAEDMTLSSFGLGSNSALNFTKLVSVGSGAGEQQGQIFVLSFTSLETLNFPALTYARGFAILANQLLTTLTAPVLAEVGGAGLTVASDDVLTAFSFPALTTIGLRVDVGALSFGGTLLDSVDFPVLAFVGDLVSLGPIPALTTVNFPALTSMAGFQFWSSPSALETLTLPVIQHLTSSTLIDAGGESLTTFTLGASLKSVVGDMVLTSAALLQASVDGLLVRLAALDGTGGTTSYDNKTVTITGTSASPSATGLAAKATLEGRGCTVTVN